MDEFYEYWELLPENEKYEVIGQEIVKYKRNLQDPEVSSRDLSENVIHFFQDQLLNNPYPTYFLIYHIIDIKDHEKNQLLEEIIFNTIIRLMDLIIEHPDQLDKQFKLFNLLSNVFISDYGMQKIYDIIIPALYDLKENRGLLDNASTYFSLLSRNSLCMLRQYLDYEHSRLLKKFDERTAFLKCYYHKNHWIKSILNEENNDFLKKSWSKSLYNTIQICKTILKMNQYDEDKIYKDIQLINQAVIENDILKLCFLEASRQCELSKFARIHSNNSIFDTTKSHVMTQLLKQQISFSMENYDNILDILNRNHEINLIQREIFQNKEILCERTEMQLFNEYMILKIYLVDILQEKCFSIDESLKHVIALLKKINDGNMLYKLIKITFSLVFLRYDHIRKTRLRRKGNDFNSTDNTSTQNNSTDVSDSVLIDSCNNVGFICTRKSLKIILNSIRLFLVSLDINEAYKNSNHKLKEKFAKLLQCVDKGLWKLALIDKQFEQIETQKSFFNTSREWLFIHDGAKSAIAPEKTSDEEKYANKKKMCKKKSKKRSKQSIKSDDHRDEDSENENLHNSTITETSENKVKLNDCKKPENVINKMLMTPESLIAMCAQKKDFDNVQKIIQEYNLSETSVDNEIKFLKYFDKTVQELFLIKEKYGKIKENTTGISNNLKNSAELGFELAKLIDVLEKFCASKEIKHFEMNDELIEKVISQHPNVWAYKSPFPIITIMIDFIISLSDECDLNLAISKFIYRKWNFLGEDRNHFYIGFLKNIFNILTIFSKTKSPTSISSFFNNEIYCCETNKFKIQMENRQYLMKVVEFDLENLNDESILDDISLKLEKFEFENNYFKRVLNNMRNTRQIAKFQTNDFLNINKIMIDCCVTNLIGNIIYMQQYNPDMLANFCFDANINLLHAIAIAGSGEILPPKLSMGEDEKLLSLFHLNQIGSKNIESNPEVEKELLIQYDISNTDILYYIKKHGSFLVAYLLKEIQNFDYKTLKYDEPNFFERTKNLKSVQKLIKLYDGNAAIAVLKYNHNDLKKLFKKIDELDLLDKLEMLECITEKNWKKDKVQFDELRDSYIEMLIEKKSTSILELLKQIGNVKKFNELLLKHIREIKDNNEVERLLGWSLCNENSKEINEEQKNELQKWIKKLKIYQEILSLYSRRREDETEITWLNILDLAENNTSILVDFLINIEQKFSLCYELLKLHPFKTKSDELYRIFIEALNKKELNNYHSMLFKIIRTFPTQIVLDFFNYSLNIINNIESMKIILNDLTSRNLPIKARIKHQKFQISCKIIEHLGPGNNQLWLLAPYPLIILEQTLMNSKIEVLSVIVKELREFFKNQPSCNICSTTSKSNQINETLVYDYDAHHKGMWISNDCIDFLFKIYAAKALDFQIVDINSQYSQQSTASGTPSIDSFQNKIFQMPKDAPTKDLWIPDNETASCMCCKKSKFSLLNRRHHCRRCGRVVCADCTRNRILLTELYNDLLVRCCDECFTQIEDEKKKVEVGTIEKARSADIPLEWRLTGDVSVDQMIRDEFIFEYSPNVFLCIAIICLHTINDEFTNFLLFHCHRLELLLRPINGKINPEIDISLVAKMLKNLAMTAKLFGDMGESNLIIDHADMILKIAENDESILSKASFSNLIFNISIRDVVNELIKSENWKLAVELSVKWDRSTKSGIFSAWAASLIKGQQYKLAREKIALALQPVPGSSVKNNEQILTAISSSGPLYSLEFIYKRPARSSPLLYEIMEVIESCVPKQSIMSVSTLSVSLSQKLYSSSLKIVNNSPLENNLKKIMEGDYGGTSSRIFKKLEWNQIELLKSHYYEESMHYLITYGGNGDILDFLMKNRLIRLALRFTLLQKVPYDMFTQFVFIPIIKTGKLNDFIETIKQIDQNFVKSKNYILSVCKYLERKKSFHVLYQLQLLIEDYIRAALTSLKFYFNGAGNYHELNERSRHLIDAKSHLEIELERVEQGLVSNDENQIRLHWDIKTINAQINIISLQMDVSKYLENCELNGFPTLDLMPKIFMDKMSLKTLLGKENEKNQVAILLLICGQSVESAFGLSYRIIQECSLTPSKIYTTCTKFLARDLRRLNDVAKLIGCIKANASSSENCVDTDTEKMCDELIAMAVEIAYTQHQSEAKIQIDQLIKLISSKTMKIQCYINSNQLKTAFVSCAALPNNFEFIRRIMKQAEVTRQENIRRLCEKKLQQSLCSSMNESLSSSFEKFC